MDNLTDFTTAAATVANPQTSAADLAAIAQNHPNLRPAVAGHPNAYPALLDWLNQTGDPAVQAAVAARRGVATPAPTFAPATSANWQPSFQPAASQPATAQPAVSQPPYQGYSQPSFQPSYQGYSQGYPAAQPAPRRGKGALIAVLIVVVLALIAALVILVIKPGGLGSKPTPAPEKVSPHAPWTANWGNGDQAAFTATAITPDGGVVAIGCTESATCQSLTDVTGGEIVKYNPDATLAWSHTYGDSTTVMEFSAMAVASDGTIVVVGFTDATSGDISSSHGGLDAVIAAFSADGTLKWTKAYGGSDDDWFNGVAISDSTIYVIGVTKSSDNGFSASSDDRDAIAASITLDGDLNWIKSYGGEGGDYFNGVAIASDGTIIVAGLTDSTSGDFPSSHGDQDAMVASLKTDGTLAWGKTFGGSGNDSFYTVAPGPGGSIIAGGYTESLDGDFPAMDDNGDAVVVSVSSSGTLNWSKVISGSDTDSVDALAVGSDGTIVAAGDTYSTDGDFADNHGGQDAFVLSLSSSGVQNWVKCYGGSSDDWFNAVTVAANGNIVVAGGTSSSDGDFPATNSAQDAVVASLTPSGALR